MQLAAGAADRQSCHGLCGTCKPWILAAQMANQAESPFLLPRLASHFAFPADRAAREADQDVRRQGPELRLCVWHADPVWRRQELRLRPDL